jgi:hypothetical protein
VTPTDAEIKAWQAVVGAKPDGSFGPKTIAATIEWAKNHGWIMPPKITLDARQRVVSIALSFLGEQDPNIFYRDAAPQYADRGQEHTTSWCGIFWLSCLRRAGLTTKTWITGRGFAYGYLPTVSIPEPGDGVYWGMTKNQHYAVVEHVENGRVYTLDGNTMTAPKEGVTARSHELGALPKDGCYFSIRTLI